MAPGRRRARRNRDGVVRARTAFLRYPRLQRLRLGSRGSRQAAAADGFHREVPLRSHTEDPGTRPQSGVSGGSDESDREKEDPDATNHGGRQYMRSAVASRCDPGLIQSGWRRDSLATVVSTVRMAIACLSVATVGHPKQDAPGGTSSWGFSYYLVATLLRGPASKSVRIRWKDFADRPLSHLGMPPPQVVEYIVVGGGCNPENSVERRSSGPLFSGA